MGFRQQEWQNGGMRRIALLLMDGVRMFDVSVVTEVFRNDRLPPGQEPFELRSCGPGRRPVTLDTAPS